MFQLDDSPQASGLKLKNNPAWQ